MKIKKIPKIFDSDDHELAKRKILIDGQDMTKEMGNLLDLDTDTLIKNVSLYPDIQTILAMEKSSRQKM